MKCSKQLFLFFCVLFLFYPLNSIYAFNDEKINLEIELVNTDSLLSNKYLKKEKHIVFDNENVTIKFFEKIHKNILEKAFIIAEKDDISSIDNDNDANLLKLKNSDNKNSVDNKDNDDYNDDDNTDNVVKVISSEESTENDVHMLRKVYQKTSKNKETTYCYMLYTFNSDLEKMSEKNLSDLFASLDNMPDYVSFLSKKKNIGDTQQILENENSAANNGHDENKFTGISAVELNEKENRNGNDNINIIDITRFVRNLDDIINYLVLSVGSKAKSHAVIKKLSAEREYLYNLEAESHEKININNLWDSKSKFERFYIHKALDNIIDVYFNTEDLERMTSKSGAVNPIFFLNIIERTLFCGEMLSQVDVLDYVMLEKLQEQSSHVTSKNALKDMSAVNKCKKYYEIILQKNKNVTADDVQNVPTFVNELKEQKDVNDIESNDKKTINVNMPQQKMEETYLENEKLDEQLIKLKNEIESDEAFIAGQSEDIVVPLNLLNLQSGESCEEISNPEITNNSLNNVKSLVELNQQMETTKRASYDDDDEDEDEDEDDDDDKDDEDDDDKDDEDDDDKDDDDKDDDDKDDDNDNDNDDDDDNDDDEDNEDNDDDEDSKIGFKEMLKKEAKKGISVIGKHVKNFAMQSGKKIFNNAVKLGKKKATALLGKLSSKIGLNPKSLLGSKKSKKSSPKKVKKVITKANKKKRDNKTKSASFKKAKAVISKNRSNGPKNIAKKTSTLRSTKGRKGTALISLSAESKKNSKNAKAIKQEIKKIRKTYKKLKEKKESLKDMLKEPAFSDKKIIEEFESYMKTEKAQK